MITYSEVEITVDADWNDILIAELGDLGFDSFVENDETLLAYIPTDSLDIEAINELLAQYADQTTISYTHKTLETTNWNEEWERNYDPIEVANRVRVRASFHAPDARFEHEIVIDPKMSFGTGHHETTSMMIEQQLGIDHIAKSVLDVGSGTGILAIMAEKLGATDVLGFDIEEWAYLNAIENAEVNHCQHVKMFQGTIADCPEGQYDIILANINRNILLQEIPIYTQFMKPNATLLVSGFYEADRDDIAKKAAEAGLRQTHFLNKNQWACVRFERS